MKKRVGNRCNCKKEINRINRVRYGLFWRFKRNTILLDEINENLRRLNENIDKIKE